MKYFVVNIETISSLNLSDDKKSNYKLHPVTTKKGLNVLPCDLLTDQHWSFAFEYLETCEVVDLNLSDFETVNISEI